MGGLLRRTPVICPHDWYLYGDKLGDNVWFCWGCCGKVMSSSLAGGMVLIEQEPTKQDYCNEQIEIVHKAFRKMGDEPPPLTKNE